MVAFNRFNKFRKRFQKRPKKVAPKRAPPKKGGMTFVQKVQKIIASNVENKYTSTEQTTLTILDVSSTYNPSTLGYDNDYKHLVWTPGSTTNMWRLQQGVEVNQRIANSIKIKKWIIKGIVQPNPDFIGVAPQSGSGTVLGNTSTGYIDIYFGRILSNLAAPTQQLTNFYQNGNVDITPLSKNIELLYRVNRDYYKVYWHKRFKMSTGNVGTTTTNLNFPQSNDFQMTRSFGFDITQYILKNKQLKYDEQGSFPQQGDLNNLSVWAIWHPAVGNPQLPMNASQHLEQQSFYQINLVSYGEFEDA